MMNHAVEFSEHKGHTGMAREGPGHQLLIYKDVRVCWHRDRQLCNQRLLVRSELFQLELKQFIGICRQHTGGLANRPV